MDIKVTKFGGSSLATAEQFEKVAAIIQADPSRRYVVPSAPGKAPGLDEKITDLLSAARRQWKEGEKQARALFEKIEQRYCGIVTGLGTGYDILSHLHIVWDAIVQGADADYAASRGEYLNGLILAHLLGYDFVDPAEGIVFDERASLTKRPRTRSCRPFSHSTRLRSSPAFTAPCRTGASRRLRAAAAISPAPSWRTR